MELFFPQDFCCCRPFRKIGSKANFFSEAEEAEERAFLYYYTPPLSSLSSPVYKVLYKGHKRTSTLYKKQHFLLKKTNYSINTFLHKEASYSTINTFLTKKANSTIITFIPQKTNYAIANTTNKAFLWQPLHLYGEFFKL